MKKYTEQDLLNLIAEVEVEFKKHLEPTAEGEQIKKNEEAPVVETKSESSNEEYDSDDMAEVSKLYSEMSKSEAQIHFEAIKKALGVEEASMAKSEESEDSKILKSENETLKSENEELKKSLNKVTEVLNKVFGKGSEVPKQKSITNMEVIKKSEEEKDEKKEDFSKLNKNEISSRLSAKVKSGKLEKKDAEAIKQYYNNGSIELVKHLL